MFELDTLSTLVAATLVLLLGRKLVQSVSLLKNIRFRNRWRGDYWSRLLCWY